MHLAAQHGIYVWSSHGVPAMFGPGDRFCEPTELYSSTGLGSQISVKIQQYIECQIQAVLL